MKEILYTQNLSKIYKGCKANDSINIHVKENSIYGLLGPNGAGKSTLLKMITGMSKPSQGKIYFQGEEFSRANLDSIGSLIESAPLYDNLTAYENLKARAILYDLPDSRIYEVLEIVNLQNTGKKKAKQFSMGMKQRLGIALALLNNPKLLILDEPTNGLDPIGIEDLRNLIKFFPQKGITVILSSHILSEIEKTCDHIGIISNGRLGYENKIDKNQDLEELFISVVRKEGEKIA